LLKGSQRAGRHVESDARLIIHGKDDYGFGEDRIDRFDVADGRPGDENRSFFGKVGGDQKAFMRAFQSKGLIYLAIATVAEESGTAFKARASSMDGTRWELSQKAVPVAGFSALVPHKKPPEGNDGCD